MIRARALSKIALAVALLVACFAVAASGDEGNQVTRHRVPASRVTIVYRDNEIKPENQQAVAVIRTSRVIEQIADWMNRSVALPHDLVVNVTDALPPGVEDPVTQPDGRTIYVPASFLTQIERTAGDVVNTVTRPAVFPPDKYNAADLNALTNQFIFGHEMGHALQRQLELANIGLEEDAADGFASFHTINELGPVPILAGALLFDEIARREGALTLEGLSSDHPVTQQRVFNFLCLLYGSDAKRFHGPLVDAGYLPKSRAPMCPQAWAMLNFGWWTQLEPHFRRAFRAEGTRAQENAREKLIAETKALAECIDKFRTGQPCPGLWPP
jgi:hypothetical protein